MELATVYKQPYRRRCCDYYPNGPVVSEGKSNDVDYCGGATNNGATPVLAFIKEIVV